jgi:hypothetical protein
MPAANVPLWVQQLDPATYVWLMRYCEKHQTTPQSTIELAVCEYLNVEVPELVPEPMPDVPED